MQNLASSGGFKWTLYSFATNDVTLAELAHTAQFRFHLPYTDLSSNKSMNREQLLDAYIDEIIDGMDHKTMYHFVYDTIEQSLETYTDEELRTEVKDYYPHLLEPSISELEATADDYGCGK